MGYDVSDPANPFLILKNSYGPDWGERGFVRWSLGPFDRQGVCGIVNEFAVFPVV